MRKRFLGSVLSILMLMSCISFTGAQESVAITPLNLSSVKANNSYVGALMNYSERDVSYDAENDIVYERFISADKTDEDVINPGASSPNVYIDRYNLGIDTSSLSSVYVAFYARTNAASTPQFFVLGVTGASQYAVTSDVSFKGDESWELLVFEVPCASGMTKFNQAHLRLGTPDDKYFDLAAYGIFSSEEDAANYDWKTAVKPDSSTVRSVTYHDADENVTGTDYGYTVISSSLSVVLPDYEDEGETVFAGWTETKGSYDVVAGGGATYTLTGETSLYPVWVKNVRFVNGSVTESGNGFTADTAYKTFAEAASALNTSGGTIVVSGETTDFSLANTGDIVITSVYDGVDYRENGAKLNFGSSYNKIIIGYVENPGKVTFENITTIQPSADGWHLMGHDVVIKDTVKSLTSAGGSASIQIMAVCSSNATPPESIPREISLTVDNTNNSSVILGSRKEQMISGANITVNGQLGSIAVSNNTYEKDDWLNVSPGFGRLTVNGDVKITVNGNLTGNIYSRKHVLTADSYDYGLKEIKGNIAVTVNHGGTYAGSFDDIIKARTAGKWLKITGIEGTTLEYGENADDIVLTLDDGLDYNFVNLTNTTTSKAYAYFIENGVSEFTLPESGVYTMTLSKNESKTISFVDAKGGNTVEDITTIGGLSITLPTLEDTDLLVFKGWADSEDSEVVKYAGGATYIVSDTSTLYAVWEEPDSYTVTFMNGEEEFASFTGVEGKEIKYPDSYPSKSGAYFTGWDKKPAVIGTEDITINATFKTADEIGYYVYYWNGDAAEEGNGTYEKPFKQMSSLVKALNQTGGTVVCIGKCLTMYQPTLVNTVDVTFTALDPLTGVDYRAEIGAGTYDGGHIYMPAVGTYWGGANYQLGAIKFNNIDILNELGQYGRGHWTFDGHPYEIGENVRHYNPATGAKLEWFLGATSPNYTATPHAISAVIKSEITGAHWLARGGGVPNVDSIDYEFYAPAILTLAQDGSDAVTINGPMRFTYYNGSTGSKLSHSKAYAFGTKAYASVILNDGVTITNSIDVSESTGLAGKLYVIVSPEGGTVTHTDTKGEYHIESDEYNYAVILDGDGDTVSEGIIRDGADLTVPGYGTYTVEYSNKTIYGVTYVTPPYDSICPDSFAVTIEETDKHTVTLPTLSKQAAHTFEGWTTVDGGTTVEYEGDTEYTLTGEVTMYAVWKAVPTFTVTFKDDDGNEIHKSTGYEGAPIDFPEKNPYRYGEKLLGYAYEGTTEVLGKDAVNPGEDKVAVPVWGEIPAGETRLYVNASTGNDSNAGTSPDTALATISKAVAALANDGGYIIVTGGKNVLPSGWNNAGDITLTSLDPASGIDYRPSGLSDDKLTFKDGAVITYKYTAFGTTTITGKITIDYVTLLNAENYQFLCFEGHPYEIGKGISVYQQVKDGAEINTSTLHVRSLGEGASRTNPEGIIMTINGLENGTSSIYTVGKATNTVAGITVTVDSDYAGSLSMGNDSGGGLTTINGDIKFTFNGSLGKAMIFTAAQYTNPVQGNVYAIYNNGSTANISAMKLAEGYGIYTITAGNGIIISHGDTSGEFVIEPKGSDYGKYIKIIDDVGNIVQYTKTTDGKAEIALDSAGDYVVEYTDTAMYTLTFITGDEDIDVAGGWYTEGSDVKIPSDIYRYGYNFAGWTDGTSTYTEGIITMPSENVTLTAIWTDATKYKITFDANGSDIVVPSDTEEFEGESILLEKVSSDRYTFVGWNTDKDAKTGILNPVITSDTTFYAITTDSPVYIVDSYYRGDPNNYTGERNSFRRYVIDVYLENAVASEGQFKLNTDNKFLYYLGHVPQEGINATVTANVISGSSGTPGLQYFTTPSVEFKWTSDTPVDTTNGRIRVARIMMYFSSWGMGYDRIEACTTDEAVSAFDGYTAMAGEDEAYVSANFYKGVKSDEVKITGKVTLEGRESGTSAKYDFAKLYILDEAGDAVDFKVLEDANSTKRTFDYSTDIIPGSYTFVVMKNGYITREIPVTVTEEAVIPEIVMYAGDTLDDSGSGDGVIDIDDFTRILRGFSKDFPLSEYINAIDLNEDEAVNVSDLAIIKNGMSNTVKDAEIETVVDKENYKLSDWKISVFGNKVTVTGGSDTAVENAKAHIENAFLRGDVYKIPTATVHTEDYDISTITLDGVSINKYRIVIAKDDEIAAEYAQYIYDYIAEVSGYGLEIVYDTEDAYEYEILVGTTSRKDNPITAVEEYSVYEEDGKFYVFYGDEQSAEMACLDLCEKILGKDSEGYDGFGNVEVVKGTSHSGKWSVLSRFGVMSDSHIGARYNWANYNWLHNAFTTFENAHAEKPLDFVVSLGDNIDDGYASTYAADYKVYLEEIKELDICDPVNPIDGRADGTIPHYELCGNHDPIGGQTDASGDLKIRFFKNKLWYTENEDGEKVAHIGFFTNYGGYPLYDYAYSGTYASYFSYGKVDDEMVKFVEESIIEANAEGAKHIILYNHFGMSQQVGSPCLPESGLGKIADVCEKYGIKLYFNGHEHDSPYTLRRYNDIYDYDVSMTNQKHAVVEITTLRAKVTIYNSSDNSIYREDIVPLSGRGEAKQYYAG